ncbi:hypothetical protein QYF36_024043 [Acer negundo]|nr:hypothetical protein QYF36_024043 [Acer negundo]
MLPSSIEHLSENSELSMRYCKNLESLPNSLCNGPNLSYLHLSGSPGVEKMLENVLSSSSSPSDDRFNTGNSFSCQKARFRFSTSSSCCKVKGCGINLVYSDQKDVFEWMNKLGTQMMLSERKKKKQKIAHSESEVNTLCRSPQGRDKFR